MRENFLSWLANLREDEGFKSNDSRDDLFYLRRLLVEGIKQVRELIHHPSRGSR